MRRILGLASMLLAFHEPALGADDPDRPFGFEFGKPITEYRCRAGTGPVHLCSAPDPDERFTAYRLTVSETSGVCAIAASSKTLGAAPNDRAGDRLREAIDSLAAELGAQYGAMSKHDERPSYVQDRPREWTKGLFRGDARYAYVWDRNSGATLPRTVERIILAAWAPVEVSAFLAIEFTGWNAQECLKEVEAAAKR